MQNQPHHTDAAARRSGVSPDSGLGIATRPSVLAIGCGLLAFMSAETAFGGQVTPGAIADLFDPSQDSCDDPRTLDDPATVVVENLEFCEPAAAPGGLPERPGDIRIDFHFRAPPLQVQVDQAVEQLRRANRILCDASEGYLRLRRVDFTVGDEQTDSGDIWWFPQPGRAYAGGYPLGSGGGHITVFDYIWDPVNEVLDPNDPDGTITRTNTSVAGDVLAHELGHMVFGLGDLYAEDAKFQGPAFDGQGFGGRFRSNRGADLARRQLPQPGSEQAHSIMQGASGQVCTDPATGLTMRQTNPLDWRDRNCLTDDDCDPTQYPVGPFTSCPEIPSVMSELSTEESGFDVLKGSLIGNCPDPTPGLELVISGYYNRSGTCDRDADGEDGDLDPFAGEECEASVATSAPCDLGDLTQTMTCSDCLWERSACALTTPACGDGAVTASEECDDGDPVTDSVDCAELGLSGGQAQCVGCVYDRSACELPGDLRLGADLDGVPGSKHYTAEVRDGSFDEDQAYHTLVIDFLRRSTTEATLLVGIDAGEFQGGTSGDYHQLAVWDLEWAPAAGGVPGSIQSINGEPYDPMQPEEFPVLELGSDTGVATHMDPMATDPRRLAVPTGLFANNAPPQTVRLHIENLTKGTYQTPDGSNRGFIHAGARNGVGPNGADIPQLGYVDKTFTCTGFPGDQDAYCRIAYNETTKRFELTADSFRQVKAACKAAADPSAVLAAPFDSMLPEWTQLFNNADDKYGLFLRGGDVDPLPDPDPITDPIICPDPQFPTNFTVDRPVEIVLVLDRSRSMEAEVPKIAPRTRLDFAKAAARAVLQVHATDTDPSQVGVVWFNEAAEVVEPASGNTLRSLVQTVSDPLTEVTPDELSDVVGVPDADGYTAIGEALDRAHNLFSTDAQGKLQSIILLSDGGETAFQRGLSNIDPQVKARDIVSDPATDIRIYTVPAGQDADRVDLAALAEDTGGVLLDAQDPVDLPPLFFEAAVRQKGQALAHHHTDDYELEQWLDESGTYYTFSHTIEVEAGSDELVVLASATALNYGSAWWPYMELYDSSGDWVDLERRQWERPKPRDRQGRRRLIA